MKISFTNSILNIYVLLSSATYVTSHKLGLGEFIAEGLPLLIGHMILLKIFFLYYKKSEVSNVLILLAYAIIFYLIVMTAINYLITNRSIVSYIFIYSYIPLLYMVLISGSGQHLRLPNEIIYEKYQKFLMVFGIVVAFSGLISAAQLTDSFTWVPAEGVRARGLMRNTLNFSTLSLLGICAIFLLDKPTKLKFFLYFGCMLGLLAAQSRGALLATVVLASAYYFFRFPIKTFLTTVGIVISANTFILFFANQIPQELVILSRFIKRLQERSGDNDRMELYFSFVNHFNIFGNGVGTTGPAAGRFGTMIAHESYILNILYQVGLLGVLLFILVSYFFIIKANTKLKSVFLSLLVCAVFQQTFETPSLNTLAWVILFMGFLAQKKTQNAHVKKIERKI